LGEAYLRLAHETQDRLFKAQFDLLHQTRSVQAITAYHHALLLQPDLAEAHGRLAATYGQLGYGDLRLKHLREELRIRRAGLRTASRPTGATDAEWKEQLEQLKQQLDNLENAVADQEAAVTKSFKEYEVTAATFRVIDRAQQALQRGLPGKALEVLEGSDISAFGPDGMYLEINLFLLTGRTREVRKWMEPKHEETLGPQRYGLLQYLMFAATGDYDAADAELERMAARPAQLPRDGGPSPLRIEIATIVGRLILDGAVADGSPWRVTVVPVTRFEGLSVALVPVTRFEGLRGALQKSNGLREQATFSVLRAVLAVEVGDDARARDLLREYLDGVFISEEAVQSGAGLDFRARELAQRYQGLLTGGAKR
jgi:hypothetical protein